MDDSLQRRFLDRLESAPDHRALTFYGPEGHRWLDRRQLFEHAAGAARRLAEHRLGAGDVCVLMLPSSPEVPILVLGCMLLGAVPLLLAPPVFWKGREEGTPFVDGLLHRCRARLAIVPGGLAGGAGTRRPPRLAPEDLRGEGRPADLEPYLARPDDRAALQATSGTTGLPRICVWTHRQVLAALDGMAAALRLPSDTAFFNWTPLYHDLGLVNNFLFCLAHGVPVAMMSPNHFVKQPADWLRGLSDTGATMSWSPNFGFSYAARRVEDGELEGVGLGHVTALWNAAEKIHLESVRAFRSRFAPLGLVARVLASSYGCAENVGGATFGDRRRGLVVEHVDRRALLEERVARPLPESDPSALPLVGVGRAHSGVRIRIAGDAGEELADGRVGEVLLDSRSRMEGYLDDARASAEAFEGTSLRTGDLGYLRDGELFWVGRVRERINIRGLKLDPSVLEPALLAVDGLREGAYAAFGIDDPELGTQRLVVVAETRKEGDRPEPQVVAALRREVLRRLEVRVDEVILVPPGTLGKTSSGKRRHLHFRRLYLEGGLA